MSYETVLEKLCQGDPRVVVMTAENRAAIRHLPERLGDRFVDVGICEQTLIGAAAGLALRGRVPVCHALATFLVLRAFEFIRTDVGVPRLPVKLVGAVPGFLSEANGPTHQAIEDVAVLRTIPHLRIVCPADEEELDACMPDVVASPDPVYVRFCAVPRTVKHVAPFAFGKAEIVSEGSDVAILTYGFLLREAARAREILEERGLSVRLVNLRTLEPLDEAAVLEAARGSRLVATFEDHLLVGGLYSIVCELLVRSGTTAHVLPVGLEKRWFKPALLEDVLAFEGFTGDALAKRIVVALDRAAA
jgi:transketolase